MTPLLEPAPDPKTLLADAGLLAKKSFGQNFLRDHTVHQRVAASLQAGPEDTIVELGSGLGTLTWYLAQTEAKRVIAIERDRDLVPILRELLKRFPKVEVVEGDAKKVSYADYGRVHVAGNIPYQLTSPILFDLFEQRAAVDAVALLVQREVADRIVAPPGNKTYGLLSVLLGAVATPRRVCNVGRGAFHPPPRVDSAVIGWRFTHAPLPNEAAFVSIVKRAFQQRRKQLRNSLSGVNLGPIDPERRPETLSPQEFVQIAAAAQ